MSMIRAPTFFSCPVSFIVMVCFYFMALSSADYGHAARSISNYQVNKIKADGATQQKEVGVVEKLGRKIPLSLSLIDSESKELSLSAIIDRPTILVPIFYHCPNICPIMLHNLAGAIKEMKDVAGIDFRILSFSFDEHDSPISAKREKKNILAIFGEDFLIDGWKFMIGDNKTIQTLTEAIGFSFQRQGEHRFLHPSVAIAVAADGKIIRYLYGPSFLPLDLSMAIAESEKGTPSISIKKILTFCFNYDPESRSYVFQTFRVFALITLILLFLLYFFVLRKGNR